VTGAQAESHLVVWVMDTGEAPYVLTIRARIQL
jgi:hypothetical protein